MAKVKVYDDGNHLTGVAQTVPIYQYMVDFQGEGAQHGYIDEALAVDMATKIRDGALVLLHVKNFDIGAEGTTYKNLIPFCYFGDPSNPDILNGGISLNVIGLTNGILALYES